MKMKSATAAPLLCLVTSALALAARFIDPARLGLEDSPHLSIIVLQLLIFAVPAIFFCKLRPETCTASAMKLRFFKPDALVFTIFATGALVAGSCALRSGLYTLFPAAASAGSTSYFETFSGPAGGSFYNALAFALLPALTEEFLFRSVLMAEYESAGIAASVVITSACFALLHYSIALFPVYFFCGVVLAFIAVVTRSVLASMAAHTLTNLVTLWGDAPLRRLAQRPDNTFIFICITAAVFLLFAALTFGEAQRIYGNRGVLADPREKPRAVNKKERAKRAAEAFSSPLLITFTALCIIITIAAT